MMTIFRNLHSSNYVIKISPSKYLFIINFLSVYNIHRIDNIKTKTSKTLSDKSHTDGHIFVDSLR